MRIGVALPTGYYNQLTLGANPVDYLLDQARKLAVQAQAAQAAGNGRFEFGLGLSLPEIAAGYGNTHPRIRYLREYLIALRDLLHTGAVDNTGETLVAKSPTPSTSARDEERTWALLGELSRTSHA